MQEFSDSRFDALIESSLHAKARLSPAQKGRAWESVYARASLQTALPAPTATTSRLLIVAAALRAAARWLVWMCMDETHYERAIRFRLEAYPVGLSGEALSAGLWPMCIVRGSS